MEGRCGAFSPTISASGGGRCRAFDRLTDRESASLPDEASTPGRRTPAGPGGLATDDRCLSQWVSALWAGGAMGCGVPMLRGRTRLRRSTRRALWAIPFRHDCAALKPGERSLDAAGNQRKSFFSALGTSVSSHLITRVPTGLRWRVAPGGASDDGSVCARALALLSIGRMFERNGEDEIVHGVGAGGTYGVDRDVGNGHLALHCIVRAGTAGDTQHLDDRAAVVQELACLAVVPLDIDRVGPVGGLYSRGANRVELRQQFVACNVDGPGRSPRSVRGDEYR